MRMGRWVAVISALAGAALALAPACALAAVAPTITSISPNEIGSSGNLKVTIRGANFVNVAPKGVHYGENALTRRTSGTAAKGQFRVISSTEIEMIPPAHEHGQVVVQVCAEGLPAEEACSSGAAEAADTVTLTREMYINEAIKQLGTSHFPILAYGQLELQSPQTGTQLECVNLAFGAGWNEAPTGRANPATAHGEIVEWLASGHSPAEGHPEIGSNCRLVYHGVEENQPTSPVAWASAELPLNEVTREAEVCIKTNHDDIDCWDDPTSIREDVTVSTEVTREASSLPWNVQFTERGGAQRVRIGLPSECKGKAVSERTELSSCPEASEREAGASPQACGAESVPEPPGCLRIQALVGPPLNVSLEYEGYVEPSTVNGAGNGLSPSSWQFEGSAAGEAALHLSGSPTTEGSVTGALKLIGAPGRELLTLK